MTIELKDLYKKYYGVAPEKKTPLPEHSSSRKLFRFEGSKGTCIGVYYDNLPENNAFLSFSRSFKKAGFPVAEIYLEANDRTTYLIEDLGDQTLYNKLQESRSSNYEISDEVLSYYKKALEYLVKFQIIGKDLIDYKLCYQGDVYDQATMLLDLQSYEHWFVKQQNISYSAKQLHADALTLTKYLTMADNRYFMYRDFQARNIMIRNNQLYFIDYQTGRKGPLQCDVVSLLYQSQARLPEKTKIELLDYYLTCLNKYIQIDEKEFKRYYYAFVMLRLFQVLATYGREGLINKKDYFLKGIPLAQSALKSVVNEYFIKDIDQTIDLPELTRLANL